MNPVFVFDMEKVVGIVGLLEKCDEEKNVKTQNTAFAKKVIC